MAWRYGLHGRLGERSRNRIPALTKNIPIFAKAQEIISTRETMISAVPIIMKRWLSQRHFYAGICIPLFAVFILLIGGFRNIMIVLDQARTTATITAIHHSNRPTLYYRYEVGGHTYTGEGGPDHPAFTPPFAVDDTFEVRYSKLLPFFSTAENPLIIFGQFGVGCLFLLWADFMAIRYGKRRENNRA